MPGSRSILEERATLNIESIVSESVKEGERRVIELTTENEVFADSPPRRLKVEISLLPYSLISPSSDCVYSNFDAQFIRQEYSAIV